MTEQNTTPVALRIALRSGSEVLAAIAPQALSPNSGFGHHWIKISLVGVESNRAGVGARIRVTVPDGDRTRDIYRWVNSGGAFGANPLRQEMGLGTADRIETLEIEWPTTGTVQRFSDVAVDQWIVVTEGDDTLETRPLKTAAFAR